MTTTTAEEGQSRLYFRQLLAGRDFAVGDTLAAQMANYVYAFGDRESGEAVLVDAAYAPGEVVSLVSGDGLRVVGAFVTHFHADHAGGMLGDQFRIDGIAELLETIDIPVHAQRAELDWLIERTGIDRSCVTVDEPGTTVSVGGLDVVCVHTPGHTPGSQCLLVNGHLITGDTLFLDGCGRTDLPGGDAAALYESLTVNLGVIGDETPVFPGHAYSREPTASMGEIRRHNPVLAPLDRRDWLMRFGS